MDRPQLASDSLSIVVPGIYRPLPVSTHWLFENALIGDPEYDDREVELLLPGEVATFRVGAFRVHCQSDRLHVTTEDESEFERLRDLVSGILRLLPDVKVSQLGINRIVHFYASDEKSWNAIGDSLVNNGMWQGMLPLSGMRAASFWGVRDDKYAGSVQVKVEPSFSYPRAVFVSYNDHYDLSRVDSQPISRAELQQLSMPSVRAVVEPLAEKKAIAVEVLAGSWRDSMRRFDGILERIVEQGMAS